MSFLETRGTVFRNLKEANLTELCKTVLEAPSKVADGSQKKRGVSLGVDKIRFWAFWRTMKTPKHSQGRVKGTVAAELFRWLRYG